jgi:hypothetical protein
MSKRSLLRSLGVVACVSLSAGAFAQSDVSFRLFCHSVGNNAQEPLGDRDGHAISFSQIACRTEGGPLDGGMLTGITIYEWDKTNAVGLSGSGITRKPGATSAYENSETKLALSVSDGKVTGFTGTGRGRYTMATGTAAALKGKTYTFSFRTTGPGQVLVDVKID